MAGVVGFCIWFQVFRENTGYGFTCQAGKLRCLTGDNALLWLNAAAFSQTSLCAGIRGSFGG